MRSRLVLIAVTVGEGDAARIAGDALKDGYDHLFVAGGDGTLNEVLNGAARVPGALDAMTFGIIPLGPAMTSRPRSASRVMSTPRSNCSSNRNRRGSTWGR